MKNVPEQKHEALITKEVVMNVLREHIGALNFEITDERADDSGLFFLEVRTRELDAEGLIREYTYSTRSLKTGEPLPPKIYVAYYSGDMAVGGEEVFSF